MSITRARWSTWIPFVNTGEEAYLKPTWAELKEGAPWPLPAESVVRCWTDESTVVDIELRLGKNDKPVVTGIAVRSALPMTPGARSPKWPEGSKPKPLSPRAVQRLPLPTIVKAAVLWTQAFKEEPESQKREGMMKNVVRTLSRLGKDELKGDERRRWLGEIHAEFVREGIPNPVKAMAEQMGWDPNRLHVELNRARKRGFATGHVDESGGRAPAENRQSRKRRQTRRAT
jgi:hypothetical protein